MVAVGTQNEPNRIAWTASAIRQLPAGSRLLDAGAGEQQFKKYCSHLRYVSQDVAQYNGIGDHAGLQTGTWEFGKLDIVCDISSIPEEDSSFDAILCTEVCEHLPDPVMAIKEFSRLLRAGGNLIVTAPFCSLTHFAPYHYATGLSRYWYNMHLANYGFDIVEITPNGDFFAYLSQELRRTIDVAKQYCRTRPVRFERGIVKLLIGLLLTFLQRWSSRGAASSELLCFGYFVRAVKRQG